MDKRNVTKETWRGIGALFVCHVAVVFLTVVISQSSLFSSLSEGVQSLVDTAPIAIGLTQVIYILPLCLVFRRQRRSIAMKGVIIGAGITLLLNAICVALVWLLVWAAYR